MHLLDFFQYCLPGPFFILAKFAKAAAPFEPLCQFQYGRNREGHDEDDSQIEKREAEGAEGLMQEGQINNQAQHG